MNSEPSMPILELHWHPALDLRAQAGADYCLPRPGAAPASPDPVHVGHDAALVARLLAGSVSLLACRLSDCPDLAVRLPAQGDPDDWLLQLTPGILWRLSSDAFERDYAIEETLEPHIRVFLSSTFRDMLAERNALATQVLPAVRQLCVLRGVQFTEIDLRWGITEEEAQRGDVTHLCLREIDLSRHSRPFFIGLLGERYGWVPGAATVDQVLGAHDFGDAARAQLLEASVTELEFLYGPLRDPSLAGGALVYLRSPALTEQLMASGGQQGFIDSAPSCHAARDALKDRLRAANLVRIDGYASVADAVQDIQRMLFAEVERLSRGMSRFPQLLALKRLADDALPRAAQAAALSAWADKPTAGGLDNLLLVSGADGVGKSSLLAHWMRQHQAAHPQTVCIFYPFVGGDGSTPLAFMHFVLEMVGFDAGQMAALKTQDLDTQIMTLHEHLATTEDRLLIVADGMDVLGDEGQTSLGWIPSRLAPTVKMLLSSNLADNEAALVRRGIPVHRIEGFDADEADAFIVHYLGRYGKRLPPSSRLRLVQAPLGRNPQFLRMVLDELRFDASHEGLETRIDAYLACTSRRQACVAIVLDWQQRAQAGGFGPGFARAMHQLLASADGLPEPVLHHRLGLNNADASRVLGFAFTHFLRPGGRIGVPDDDWRQALMEALHVMEGDIDPWRRELVGALVAMPPELVDPTFAAYEFARQFIAALDADPQAEQVEWVFSLALEHGAIWPIVERANELLPMLWSALGGHRDRFDAEFAQQAASDAQARSVLDNAAYVLLEYQIFWQAARACARRALEAALAVDDIRAARSNAEMLLKSLAEDAVAHREEAEIHMTFLTAGVTDGDSASVDQVRQAAEALRLFAKVALECEELELAENTARKAALLYDQLLLRLDRDQPEGGVTGELLSSTAYAHLTAGRVLRARRMPQDAEEYYAQAILIWSTVYADDNNRVLVTEIERADVLIECGPERYAEARALLDHASTCLEQNGVAGIHGLLYEAYRSLRKLHDREGDYDAAIDAARRAIDIQRGTATYLPGDEAPAVHDLVLTLVRANRIEEALVQGVFSLRCVVQHPQLSKTPLMAGIVGQAHALLARSGAPELALTLVRAADVVLGERYREGPLADTRMAGMWREATALTLANADPRLLTLPVPPLAEILDVIYSFVAGRQASPGQRYPIGTIARTGAPCPRDGVWQARLAPGDMADRTRRRLRGSEPLPALEVVIPRATGWRGLFQGERREMRDVEWELVEDLPPLTR